MQRHQLKCEKVTGGLQEAAVKTASIKATSCQSEFNYQCLTGSKKQLSVTEKIDFTTLIDYGRPM